MLLRGQNLLGYKHYTDDVVEYFVQKAIDNGMDIIRIFDTLTTLAILKPLLKHVSKRWSCTSVRLLYH